MDTKKLRQKILDLAIHGRLVPQDPNDEPASVLLQRIREEKERLIKEGKIKQPKKAKNSSDTPPYGNDAPFEVPEGWEWCRLEDIVTFGGGKTPSMDNKTYWNNGKHLWVTSKDMKSDKIDNSLIKISDVALSIMTVYPKGTLLLVTRSGILRHTLPIAILQKEATVNQDLKTISCIIQDIHNYLFYAIKAQESFILKEYHKDGTTVDSIDFDKFRQLSIPLPPLSEQHRIVSEVERWFALIDKIEQGKADLQAAVKQTKSKILDLAIHGKLVPQCADDEPATELLRRINPSAQPCDKVSYKDLPYGWIICPMGYLANIIGGVSYKKEDITTTGIRILRGGNIQEGQIETYDDDVYISSQYHSQENAVQANDIVLVASTGSSILIGKTGFANKSLPNTQIGAFLRIIRMKTPSIAKYVNCVFLSDYYKNYIRGVAKGSNINNIKNYYITDFQIPLPPLAEQHRIVSKIEELFAQLDSILNILRHNSIVSRL